MVLVFNFNSYFQTKIVKQIILPSSTNLQKSKERKQNKMIYCSYILLFFGLNTQNPSETDTIFVAKVIDMDFVKFEINKDYRGFIYYYGLFHLKVVNAKQDTMILTRLYNILDDRKKYKRKFNYKIGKKFVFIAYQWFPCNSSLPKIQGYCDEEIFYPKSNYLIKSYKKIYRIIYDMPH
jgi:hypothetical protein